MARLDRVMPESALAYYRIHFLEDGYPAQRLEHGYFEHPMYPVYVIQAWLMRNEPAFEEAIHIVARAAMSRMKRRGEGLFLVYPDTTRVARSREEHVSGLTQARYLRCFATLAKTYGIAEYVEVVHGLRVAIQTPIEQGGPARIAETGIGIEELPILTPDLILNGWLTALETTSLANRAYGGLELFLERNFALLKELLPRYDVPELCNTRYSLAGHILFRLSSTIKRRFSVDSVRIVIGETEYEPFSKGDKPGWQNILIEKDFSENGSLVGNAVRFNAVLSHFASPNTVHVEVTSDKANAFSLEANIGDYDPLAAAPMNKRWIPVWESEAVEPGTRKFIIDIPEQVMRTVGTPTNFIKKIGGSHRNVYHLIHVNALRDLYRMTADKAFLETSERWGAYVKDWPSLYGHITDFDHSRVLKT